MRFVLVLLVSLSSVLAGCGTESGGADTDGVEGSAPPASSSPAAAPTPQGSGASAPQGSGSSPSPAAQAPSSPTPAAPSAPQSLDATFRFDHEGFRQQVVFRPDGTFTYDQSLDGESGTWEGTYDLRSGTGRMNDEDIVVRYVHEDLVSLSQVLLRRVLADGTVAKPRADERIVGGEYVSRIEDKVEGFTFEADGTWSMTGSLKTATSFGTWASAGRYDLREGVMVWDDGKDQGKQAELVWWTENVVLIDGTPHVLEGP